MNIPNTITLVRLVLVPFYVDLMVYGYYGIALIVFISACATDALDGMVARLTKTQTRLGAFLDPMADKLLILSSFVLLAVMGKIPIWLAIIVVSRDVILASGSLMLYIMVGRLEIEPSFVGKLTTVMQLGVVTLVMVLMNYGAGWPLLHILELATAVVTVVSGAQYVLRGMRLAA